MLQAGFSTLNYVILFVYLGAMVTIGILVAGKQKTTEDYFLVASSQFLGLFGGPIVALFLMGMLSRRAHFRGWLAGTIPAVLITYFGVIRHTWLVGGEMVKVHFIYYFPICFGITLGIGYFASLLIPAPLADKEYTIFNKPGRSAQ